MPFPLDVPEHVLRCRRSQKWVDYPDDVLPLFVAETDVLLAPAIRERLASAVTDGDTGYSAGAEQLARIDAHYFSRFGWDIPAEMVVPVADVGVGVRETLERALPAGCDVVYTPPVYMPFAPWIRRVGHKPIAVPLVDHDGDDPRLDLDGIARAFESGARAILLSHPHNPTGHLHGADELETLAQLAHEHDALVVSDEIWAPLCLPGVQFESFLARGNIAREVGVAISSASKAFNLAGLKCAFVVHGNADRVLLPRSLSGAVGHFGALAGATAFTDGLDWLDQMCDALAANVELLDRLLAEHLPEARWRRPDAGFVAWIDLRAYPDLGDDPARHFLEQGRVALSPGPVFGKEGAGFARLNFACSEEILTEAVSRMGQVTARGTRGQLS